MQPGERVTLSAVEEKKLVDAIEEELNDSIDANVQLIDQLQENAKLYLAEPRSLKKDFPWRNASNIVIPLIGITVDSVLARMVNTIFGVDPFWTVTANIKALGPIHKEVESFLDWSVKTEMFMYRPIKTWALEVVQDGWGWLKTIWDVETRRRFVDGQWKDYDVRRPKLVHVPLVDILPQYGVDIEEEGDFFFQRVRWTDNQLRRKSNRVYGSLAEIEELLKQKEDSTTFRQASLREDGASREKMNTGYECWIDWHFGKGDIAPIVVTYHRPSKKIMRAMHNPFNTGASPFTKGRFVEIRGRNDGFGLAQQLKALQSEISTIHNQQVDNATLANTRFFVGRRGQIKADTKIWPGKVVLTSDPKSDFIPMQLGEVYNSMKSLEVTAMAYAERRSGVSDYTLGRESTVVGDRATATGTLAILQEGNRRFDLNVRDMRDTLQKVGYNILELNHQFRPRGMAYLVQGEHGESVERLLDLPPEFSALGLGLELTASTGTINRQVEQAGLIKLLGILTENLQLGQQAEMLIANPQLPGEVKEYTIKQMEGIATIVRRIAQTFEQRNAEDIVATVTAYEGLQAMAGGSGQGPTQGAISGPNNPQPQANVAPPGTAPNQPAETDFTGGGG